MLRMEKYQKTKMNDTVKQVGGDHYQNPIQPWDEFKRLNVSWAQGEIAKYLCRWPNKGGIQDLHKALSIIQKYKVRDPESNSPRTIRFIGYKPEFLAQYYEIYKDDYNLFVELMENSLQENWEEMEEPLMVIIKHFENGN